LRSFVKTIPSWFCVGDSPGRWDEASAKCTVMSSAHTFGMRDDSRDGTLRMARNPRSNGPGARGRPGNAKSLAPPTAHSDRRGRSAGSLPPNQGCARPTSPCLTGGGDYFPPAQSQRVRSAYAHHVSLTNGIRVESDTDMTSVYSYLTRFLFQSIRNGGEILLALFQVRRDAHVAEVR